MIGRPWLDLRGGGCEVVSAIGTKRTSLTALHMSAIGGKADIEELLADVWC
jgi:hypothetical protein